MLVNSTQALWFCSRTLIPNQCQNWSVTERYHFFPKIPLSVFSYEIPSLSLLKLREGPGWPHQTDEKVFVTRAQVFKALYQSCVKIELGDIISPSWIFSKYLLSLLKLRIGRSGPTQLTEWGVVSTAILPHQTDPHSPPDGRQPYLAVLPLLPCCLIIMQLLLMILLLMMQVLMMVMVMSIWTPTISSHPHCCPAVWSSQQPSSAFQAWVLKDCTSYLQSLFSVLESVHCVPCACKCPGSIL